MFGGNPLNLSVYVVCRFTKVFVRKVSLKSRPPNVLNRVAEIKVKRLCHRDALNSRRIAGVMLRLINWVSHKKAGYIAPLISTRNHFSVP
jgi:hypothetical protein